MGKARPILVSPLSTEDQNSDRYCFRAEVGLWSAVEKLYIWEPAYELAGDYMGRSLRLCGEAGRGTRRRAQVLTALTEALHQGVFEAWPRHKESRLWRTP